MCAITSIIYQLSQEKMFGLPHDNDLDKKLIDLFIADANCDEVTIKNSCLTIKNC